MPQNKLSKEELEQKEKDAIEALEDLTEKGLNEFPEESEEEKEERAKKEALGDDYVAPEDNEEEESEPEEKEEEVEEEVPEDKEEEDQAEPSKELYKKKFSESSREAQKINAKNRVLNKALADAEDVKEPTEEELQQEFSDWDVMSDIEKTLAKETIITRRWRETIAQAKDQATKIEKWNESVVDYVEDPKTLLAFPQLEGKQEDFKEYAILQENNNVPFNVLIPAFLFQQSTTNKPHKGKMFERKGGGANEKPKMNDGTITIEEARKLRETNYDLWKQKLKEGKIKNDF